MMRPPKPAFDPFASSDSMDPLSGASWKPPKEDLFAGTSSSGGGSGSAKPYKPYRRFQDDHHEIPFDQQAALAIQEAAPSFDEGTDEVTDTTDQSSNGASGVAPKLNAHYTSETDDSLRQQPEPHGNGAVRKPLSERELSPPRPHHPLPPPLGDDTEMDYHNQSFEDYGLPNPKKVLKKQHSPPSLNYHGSYEALDKKGNKVKSTPAAAPETPKARPRSILKRSTLGSDAEDSNALAPQDSSRKKKPLRRRTKAQPPPEEEDDTSLEVYPQTNVVRHSSKASVSRRTQEAFGKREKQRSPPGVSFRKRDQVHRYEQQQQDEDDETHFTAHTGTSSVNSTYSKSVESEVEDLVKDLFFIGKANETQPGKRGKNNNNNHDNHDNTTVGDSTLDTYDDATLNTLDDDTMEESTLEESTLDTAGESATFDNNENTTFDNNDNTRSSGTTTITQEEEDPLVSVWNMVAGGFSAMGAVLGIDDQGEEEKKKKASTHTERSLSRTSPPQDTSTQEPDGLDTSQTSTLADMIDMASDFLLGNSDKNDKGVDPAYTESLEQDGRLAELALYAARSKHEIHGIVFDETTEIDIVTEVKFSVVRVLLPMGILFQENDGGCWVTKVFASGNAAVRAKGGTVEVGDQLAAINGTSAIQMKVDKICSLVSEVPKNEEVELTFLRYTGPMRPRPGTIREEGYEVRDPDMERRGGVGKKKCWMPARRKVVKVESSDKQNQKKRFRLFGRKKNS